MRSLHHIADDYLHAYVEAAKAQPGDCWEKGTPLFRSQQGGGRKRILSQRRLNRCNAYATERKKKLGNQNKPNLT